MVGRLCSILFAADPVGINFGSNETEYEPEARTIAPRLATAFSVEDVRRIVFDEFVWWFGQDAGKEEAYQQVATAIWDLWSRDGKT